MCPSLAVLAGPAPEFPLVTNLAQLRQAVSGETGCLCSFALQGTVLAEAGVGTLFLGDDSGADILELPPTAPSLPPGRHVSLRGTNYIVATETGISLGREPVVENDGLHSRCEATATLNLSTGKYPIQVQWFNYTSEWSLEAAFSGPGFGKRTIPAAAFSHTDGVKADGTPNFAPGLIYQGYEGSWRNLPDFSSLKPIKSGVTPTVTAAERSRDEYVGLTFDGFLQVDAAGPYTFYLDSDDGSRLFLNHTPPQLNGMGSVTVPAPKEIMVRQPLARDNHPVWATAEGQITFWGRPREHQAELELTAADTPMRALVLNARDDPPARLLGAQVRLSGICLAADDAAHHPLADRFVVASWKDVQILTRADEPVPSLGLPPADTNQPPILTTAAQVQQLSRAAAQREYPVRLNGVVTWVSEHRDCVVLQDATRGVFVGLRNGWTLDEPRLGDLLEIEGHCEPAEFSPIVILSRGRRLGRGLLPTPMHPTWEQLIGGSLDDQYIEITGLATDAPDTNHLTLLLPGGKTELEFSTPLTDPLASFIHSVVRIRGVMFANWDTATHMVTPNRPLHFGSAVICTEVPPPANPFSADRMRARELMQFDARRSTFQRVKVSGQCLCRHDGTVFMTDEGFGFRVEMVETVAVEPGDLLEVVGLVQLGGESPLVREAIARKLGSSPLPTPAPLTFDPANNFRDASRVSATGLLLGVKDTESEHVLEMQSGLNHFAARLPASARAPWPAASRLRLTGTLSLTAASTGSPGANSVELLLISPADVVVVARPPWWTLDRLLTTVAILTLGLALAFVWITLLRAQVERRTRQLRQEISERQKAEQERAIERERSRIALDLHDDLGSRLTAISMLATAGHGAKPSPEASRERLELIADKARSMVTTLDGMVWAVDPKNDTVASLAEYVASFTEEFLARTGIVCQLELPAVFPARVVAAEARHNMLLAVRETLNNGVRHAHAATICLRLACTERELSIEILDDGRGFDVPSAHRGNGLANLQERLRKANGRCQIESSPGHGTKVLFTLPI
jgi:signal transduction histidine kinase